MSRPSMRTFEAGRVEPVAMLSERTEKTNRNADREDQQRHCRVGGHETIPTILAVHAKVGFQKSHLAVVAAIESFALVGGVARDGD